MNIGNEKPPIIISISVRLGKMVAGISVIACNAKSSCTEYDETYNRTLSKKQPIMISVLATGGPQTVFLTVFQTSIRNGKRKQHEKPI